MNLKELKANIGSIVMLSDKELTKFLKACEIRTFEKNEIGFEKNEIIFSSGEICNKIFFINEGLCRSMIFDSSGNEHTILFSVQGDFVGDYSSYLKVRASTFTIQALEKTEGILIPRTTIDAVFDEVPDGYKLGRILIERYYIKLQELMEARRGKDPLEMYNHLDSIYNHLDSIYPDIKHRVPQNIMASFLGIASVHWSRLKSKEMRNSRI